MIALGSIAGCSSSKATPATVALPQKVVITYVASSTESKILGALYAQALENAGLRVARRDPFGDLAAYYDALQRDEIQIVPAFSGDVLAYLKQIGATPPPSTTTTTTTTTTIASSTPTSAAGGSTTVTGTTIPATTTTLPSGPPHTVDAQVAIIKSLLPTTMALAGPAPAERKRVIACSKKAVDTYTVGTDTDLGVAAPNLVLGGPAGFETSTPLGLATLKDSYGASFKSFVTLTDDKIEEAVKSGTVDCAVVTSTAPVVAGQSMTILLDDKALVDPNGAIALMSATGASAEAITAINAMSAKLTPRVFNDMVAQVATKGASPELIASVFLSSSTGS